jgi:hypothetical protein
MANLGDTVILHSSGYDLAGIVAATPSSWNEAMTDTAERSGTGNPAPTGDQVYVLVADPAAGGVWTTGPCSQGTGAGQWSLPA